eukprot:scaffold12384_cov23-Tisochrysis_lutea.AAC.4
MSVLCAQPWHVSLRQEHTRAHSNVSLRQERTRAHSNVSLRQERTRAHSTSTSRARACATRHAHVLHTTRACMRRCSKSRCSQAPGRQERPCPLGSHPCLQRGSRLLCPAKGRARRGLQGPGSEGIKDMMGFIQLTGSRK